MNAVQRLPHPAADPLRLPPRTRLAVGFCGKLYPAWIERWARVVFAATGPVSKAAPVVLYIDRRDFTAAINRLRRKLERWGYANLTCIVKGDPDERRRHKPEA